MGSKPRKFAKTTRQKTVSLTLRLAPETKFRLELLARAKRTTTTKLLEDFALEKSEQEVFSDMAGTQWGWADYWHPSPFVREVKMLSMGGLPTKPQDERDWRFLVHHWPFFFLGDAPASSARCRDFGHRVNVEAIDVIWPMKEHYVANWETLSPSESSKVGVEMAQMLSDSGLGAPVWPRTGK